jgi:hypothetical protein
MWQESIMMNRLGCGGFGLILLDFALWSQFGGKAHHLLETSVTLLRLSC